MKRSARAMFAAVCAAASSLLAACTTPAPPPSIPFERELTLAVGSRVGQTYTAPHGGLAAIDVPLGYDTSGDGAITLRVFERIDATVHATIEHEPVAVVEASSAGRPAGVLRFVLPAPLASHGRSYYLQLVRTRGPPIGVGIVDAAASLDGSAYQNDTPVEAQLAMQATFDPLRSALGAGAAALGWLPVLAAAAALLLVPGSALLRLLWPDRPVHSWLDELALSAAAGAALYPLLLAWTDLVGMHFGAANFLLPIGGGAVVHIALWRRGRRFTLQRIRVFDVAALAALAALFASRYMPVASLALPLWGDAIHHTAIAQRIVDAGGYFASWQPYADAATFTYHPGFHTYLAGLLTLTGAEPAHTALVGGQLMNMLAVVALAPLASRIAGHRWAGLAAMAAAGFLISIPQIYTNWSRWTQLAGQMILPAAMLATWQLAHAPNRRTAAIAALLAAGLALTHYRIVLLWAAFAVIIGIAEAIRSANVAALRRRTAMLAACGAGAALLCAPWGPRVYQSELARSFGAKLTTPASATPDAVRAYNEASSGAASYAPPVLWAAAAAALLYATARGRRGGLLIAAWTGAVWLAANPGLLGLPGTGILSNFAIDIAAYIPVAVLIGSAAPNSPWIAAAIAAAAAYGLLIRPVDVQPGPHAMAGVADARAARWVRENLSGDAFIAINGFVPRPNGYVAGTDGGWWLRVLSGRRTTITPMQSQAELQPTPDSLETTRVLASLTDGSVPADAALARLRAMGVTHIFVGQIQGTSNHPPGGLTVAALDALPAARSVYREDRVGLYDIR